MCEYCKFVDKSSAIRNFRWYYRPRARDFGVPSDDYVLSVVLCDYCHYRVEGFECYGSDRMDALDGLFHTLDISYATKRIRNDNDNDNGNKKKKMRII